MVYDSVQSILHYHQVENLLKQRAVSIGYMSEETVRLAYRKNMKEERDVRRVLTGTSLFAGVDVTVVMSCRTGCAIGCGMSGLTRSDGLCAASTVDR